MNNAYATVGDVKSDASVKDPNLAAKKDINHAVGRNVNFPTERYVSFPAGRSVKSAKEENVNLAKETKKGVSPAAGRNVDTYAVEMEAINANELQEDEELVYCEIPYVQPRWRSYIVESFVRILRQEAQINCSVPLEPLVFRVAIVHYNML